MRLPPTDSEDAGPNLTPVIDVVFLLLIFFLVATRFDDEEKLISINLAEILQAQPITGGSKEVVVNVTQKGEYVVAGETLGESNLIDLLHHVSIENPGNRTVQIRADEDVKFRYPLTVIGICKREELDYSCTVLQERP